MSGKRHPEEFKIAAVKQVIEPGGDTGACQFRSRKV
jgi:transposase-like protein